jgi:hypothetical protein
VGFSENAVVGGYASADQAADLSAKAGASIARVMFDWRWAEPYEDDYRFKAYDKVYNAYLARGIKPIFTILFAPWWAWDASVSCDQWAQNCTYPPGREHDSDIAEMAQVLAKRYPELGGIEVWNEPNLHWFWRPKPDPKRYVEVQNAVYHAVKQVAPAMPVVNGGLNNHDVTNADDIAMGEFLSWIYHYGAGSTTDAVNIHPYPNGLDQRTFRRSMDKARYVRDYYHDNTKPLWVTEVGFSTTGVAPRAGFSLADQAQGLVDHYRVLRDQADVDLIALYTLTDTRGLRRTYDPGDVEVGFGVVDRYLNPKPAYCAIGAEWTGHSPAVAGCGS